MAWRTGALVALVALLVAAAPAGAHIAPLPGDGLLRSTRALPPPAPGMAGSWCPGDPGRTTDDVVNALSDEPDVKVIYVYARDQPNRFLQFADELQRTMAAINTLVSTAPGSAKQVRFDMGTACGPQYVDIQTVKLTKDLADLPADDLFLGFELGDQMRAAGATGVKATRRNLVFTDQITTGAAGYAPIPGDSQPGQQNFSNTGEKTSFVYGNQPASTGPFQNVLVGDYWTVHAPFHELLHILGAVGPSARHASTPQNGHCSDEHDVVCGQSNGITFPCAGTDNLMLDCGKDDYFNAQGPITNASGDAIWNVYDSQFLCPVARCHVKAPPAAPVTTSSPPPTGAPAPVTAPPPIGPAPVAARPAAARLSRLGLSPRRFRARRGAVLTFRLSAAATVRFTVERRSGRRWKRAGRAFTRRGRAGANRVTLRQRGLRRGSYRLVARVGGAAPVRTAFTIVG